MKTIIIAIAATILVASPSVTFAQDAPPEELILPGDQETPQPDKKKRKEKAQQPSGETDNQPAQAEQEQAPEPTKKRKKKEQLSGEGTDQPVQAEPPEPVVEQPVQPTKKRKQKAEEQKDDQPEQIEQGAAPEPVIEQPEKKKRKQKAEERNDQGGDQPAQVEQDAPSEPVVEKPKPEQKSAGVPPEAAEFLADKRISGDLSDAELKARISTGRALAKNERISRKQRQQALAMSKQATAELLRRQQQAQSEQPAEPEQPKPEEPVAAVEQPQPEQPKSQAEQQQAKELDGNKASPEAEAKAKEFLQGERSADQLNDEELRQRLEAMRALLGGNELSRESERALRRQLRAEREILRTRVAEKVEVEEKAKQQKQQQEEAANQGGNQGNQGKQGKDRGDKRRWNDWAANDVLRDRRDSDKLEEGELRRRIDVYRDAVDDDRYDEGNRSYWRESMGRDRRALRARMMNDRRERADDYRRRRDSGDLDFDIDINVDLDEDRAESVFADEIDDEELEEQLAAAPRRKISRRYTVEEIEDDPEIRVAMPAIEIDTVRFGFNEAFVREEEVESLDRIAGVIEKILAVHPGEVFMIEGHSDAVGSDEYNLRLSRQRAQAVKEALATFYVIPTRNLETAGYGERYLKIPTSEPEQENRRVTLRRVTPLVGEALED